MTRQDVAAVTEALVALAELFNVQLSAPALALWVDAVADLDASAVLRALRAATRTSPFMPRPAEIRAAILGHADDAVERAWRRFREAAATIDGYRSVWFEDGALAATLAEVFGSWSLACGSEWTDEMLVAKRKEFGRVYTLAARESVEPRYLPGACEVDNASRAGQWSLAGCADQYDQDIGLVPQTGPLVLVTVPHARLTGRPLLDVPAMLALARAPRVLPFVVPTSIGAGGELSHAPSEPPAA